ncbi:Protein mlp1 [Exophiala xenobiotica]|uniref:Protein mlp1 n=1 Tax=Lithohypha guttulata TaxID=1690604 RepID=A0ABR0K3X4_9EURO|nr:Protein mlp1 [Lithohypha guttulata]KAK5312586.1 Protein mlp1 [Exophiala xenobiotica]
MAADIDVRTIATFTSLTESAMNNVLDSPTTDLVKTLLLSIEKKAKEFEQSKAQKVKLEVELETVARTNESKTKVLQNSRDRALADVSKLREELQAAEGTRAHLQSEFERIQQSVESDVSETASLRSKVTSLKSSHRDTLSLLDSKSKEIDRLAQDLTDEHAKVVGLRRDVSRLEQEKQEESSKANSARFRQASLEQEVELQKKNVDWYETEHKKKAEEHQNFRKEKNARLSELQRSLEQRIEESDSLRRSENSLRSQLEDQMRRNESLQTQIQKFTEDKATDADHYRKEVDGLNRLVELQKATADTAKARVEELNQSLEEAKDDASEEIGKMRAEIQQEHNDRQAAEQRVTELEARLSDLEADLHQAQTQPQTPRNEPNGKMPSTPARPGTPLGPFTPRSTHRLKNGLSTTQMYAEYTKIEKDLASERRTNEQLQAYVDEMLADLEATKPEIEELRNDQARLQSELVEMSHTADQANQQRDAAAKEAKISRGQVDRVRKELEAAQQMSRDLGSQVRRLLLEQQAGSLSDLEYERLTKDLEEINQRDMGHLSDAQQQVNQYLLGFRNIAELQAVNERQLGTIRNLLEQVESEASQDSQKKLEQLAKDLDAANARISDYQNEINHMVTQSKSFVKERDMFRSMLTRRGQIDPNDFSRSMPLPAGGFSTSLAGDRASPAADNDLAKMLRELQNHFDDYRREASTDTTTLKSQITDLSHRNFQLQIEASKSLGQLTAANQRYDMLLANYNTLKTDNSELQKRYNAATETATKQEVRTQQAAEELIEAKGMLDGLHRESANLKAEKDLWKSVEKRLIDDNESLRNERSRLDQLNASLQNLLNEKEHSETETRRRLQSQVDNLEAELHTAKRKLDEELEEKNQTSMRRKYEHEQSQKRVDELVESLGATREELASAKTSRDHLQARVDELTVELRSAEERVEVLVRPSTAPESQGNAQDDNTLSREQELAVEVSELKRDLDLKTAELAKAEEHIEEYKGIAQAAEERLQQLMETDDEDKADLQASVNEKEQRVKDLEQRIGDISAELNTSNSELSKLRDEQAESGRRLDDQKGILQTEIDRLKASEEKASEQASLYLEASKEQQKIAEERQQNYETELLKHTEAVKNLQVVRSEANQVRLELVEAKTQAQNAKTELQEREASWADIEARYKQETLDLKTRREESEKHNKSLHESLETVTSQLASLRSTRTTTGDAAGEEMIGDSQDLSSFQETIKYLRQEKEIVEVRHHMATLELARLKRQLDSTQHQLDEARVKINQQQRATIDSDKTALGNNKLVETINELNIYRESAVTLRAEKNKAEQALKETSERIEQLHGEIIPMKGRVDELNDLLMHRTDEISLLQKDRDGWQQRTQNILSKYDRVDPAELEDLRNRVTELQTERDQAVERQTALQVQVDGIPEAVEAGKTEQKNRLTDQFKARDRKMRDERNQLQAELNSLKEQLDAANTLANERAAVVPEPQPSEAAETSESSQQELTQRVQELEVQIIELQTAVAEKDAQIASKEQEAKAREEQLKGMLNKRLAEVKKEAEAAKQTSLDELRSSLTAQHQEELETLRSQSVPVSAEVQKTADAPAPDDSGEATASTPLTFEQLIKSLNVEQARRLVAENEIVSNIVKTNIRKHVEKHTKELKEELSNAQPTASSEEIAQQVQQVEERFAVEKAAILREKDEELNAERENLVKQQTEAFEAEKQALLGEQQKKLSDEVSKAKASAEKLLAGKLDFVKKQAANSLAKVNVVKKAAEETPDKPVKEVWEVAKSAKPPTEASKPASAPAPAAASAPVSTAAPEAPASEASAPEPTTELVSEANGASSPAPPDQSQETVTATDSSQPAQPAQPAAALSAQQQQQARTSGLPQPTSQLPRGSFSNRGNRGNAQGARGTNIPRPGSAIGHHGGNVNARGRGRGHNPGSPGRGGGNLNPAAQQFTPQGKRPREDGDDSGNMGKRIRGGGTGS